MHDASGTIAVDRLDRQLIHALGVDGRASFRRLADVLETSEHTVARRYRRLRDAGVIRVIAQTTALAGVRSRVLRIQVRPSAAMPLAAALAKRQDTSWINLVAGGSEISCRLRALPGTEHDLLLGSLPRSSQVLGLAAHSVLHEFSRDTGARWSGFGDPLDPEQLRRLRVARASADHAPQRSLPLLTASDEPLLRRLAVQGRTTYAELAHVTARPEAQVARRVESLFAARLLRTELEIAGDMLGHRTSAQLWIAVPPAAIELVGRELIGHPEIAFAAAVTGPAPLVALVRCRDTDHLYRYLTERIGALPQISSVETSPILRRVKQHGIAIEGERLALAPLAM
ncbi:AsnC family transcriptional regulator [Conexibacter sp. CPCC 206217]|uniref:AsnC family transcriptional regulator n=1 Tax=Conexibacter sp. CPCC 206217 TaxID=3064574 RepID=UPI0027162AEB|nr:AsnC family transcriptional regulator [Conexibacter sp. CPCC 206217]MDO8213614.1 AsnC family transcriptional regulator [Conexibacter sp. CPCC 206217]